MCGDEAGDSPARRVRVAAALAATGSTLRFGDTRADFTEQAVVATVEWSASPTITLVGGVGAVLAGTVGDAGAADRARFRPGPLASIAVGWRILDGRGAGPFLVGDVSLAAARWPIVLERDDSRGTIAPIDARFGLTLGKTFLHHLSPYIVARLFGGPVRRSDVDGDRVGSDVHHYQVGGGLAFRLGSVDFFVEGVPVGERRIGAGAGLTL